MKPASNQGAIANLKTRFCKAHPQHVSGCTGPFDMQGEWRLKPPEEWARVATSLAFWMHLRMRRHTNRVSRRRRSLLVWETHLLLQLKIFPISQ
ncbi:hypothetical protein FKM82_001793 [Ascaphus truei]